MIEINITATNLKESVKQIQLVLGGEIKERWGEHTLTINNQKAFGTIRYIEFDRGVSMFEIDMLFKEEVLLLRDTSLYNPIRFSYCLEGFYEHHFHHTTVRKKIDQFQSVIISGKDGGYTYSYLPKEVKLRTNEIQVLRNKFMGRALTPMDTLNDQLHEVFLDTDHENKFSYFGAHNLKLADHINFLSNIKKKGLIKMLLIESKVYEILSQHIFQHNQAMNGQTLETSLLKSELKLVRKYAKKIIKTPAVNYSLESISEETGLTQAKLQEGFKLLYNRTVTEYIRHIRLKEARDLMNTTDLNVSEIVYTVGFSSRSYFSKIFKAKFNISPSEYLKMRNEKTLLQSEEA
ncbi:helix-turn-helix transcriptional regulator [Wenyingzhuangia sp. chi5]|uniref:Helix-turn-helix transcriptional regulator n=1 Tax=Wenyingzhuangia gilva TaxID=3057677 RepID=A0ABT8VST3_9FLAO|nr:AraC family transcriptional regulator [Wenyingzhuangia sp. chi5]MDO3694990.1 helix-turn-helix transcriptional regulator [Wenyingzhuangia sp. chi5]